MDKDLILGIDLSTHGVKILAIDRDGVVASQAVETYERLVRPGGIQEQPAQSMWTSLCTATKRVLSSLGSHPKIAAIAVTHQRGTVLGLNINNEPPYPAICDSDTRSWNQARWLAETVGEMRLYEQTGCPALPFNGLTKILWWYQEESGNARNVTHWASVQDWIVYKLTGDLKSSPGSALRLGVLDVQHPDQYADVILSECHLPLNVFPELVKFGTPIGHVSLEASQKTGLKQGIPVYPAPGDQPAAFLGTGAMTDGSAILNLGTSFLLSFPAERFVPFTSGAQFTLEVLPGGYYTLELGGGAGTNVLDWLRVNLFALPSVEQLIHLGMASPRGANGLFVIPRWWAILNDRSAGTITGLRNDHTRADILRATYEGLAFELRWIWEKMILSSGIIPERIALCGGASQNEILCQVISSVLQRPVYWSETKEASAYGAAIVAAVGAGWFSDIKEASRKICRVSRLYEPATDDLDFYQGLYSEYIAIRNL